MFSLKSNPRKIALPKTVMILYLIAVGVVSLVCLMAGGRNPAILAVCIGLCGFVIMDAGYETLKGDEESRGRKTHGITTCILAAAGIAACIYTGLFLI